MFADLARRIAGLYVSGIMKTMNQDVPEPIITTQFVHRQPRAWKTNPPMRGPITGPFIGP